MFQGAHSGAQHERNDPAMQRLNKKEIHASEGVMEFDLVLQRKEASSLLRSTRKLRCASSAPITAECGRMGPTSNRPMRLPDCNMERSRRPRRAVDFRPKAETSAFRRANNHRTIF